MNFKLIGTLGLVFLLVSQILLYQGFDFLAAQQPIDFAHWLMLLSAVMMISFSFIFPKSIINTISTTLVLMGIIAHVGMCTIDFVLWSYGEDYDTRNALIGHLVNTPSIYFPFMVVGPSLLYVGLATHAWQFIRTHTLPAIITLSGSFVIGFGQFMSENRIIVVIGCIVFSLGLTLLAFRKEK